MHTHFGGISFPETLDQLTYLHRYLVQHIHFVYGHMHGHDADTHTK